MNYQFDFATNVYGALRFQIHARRTNVVDQAIDIKGQVTRVDSPDSCWERFSNPRFLASLLAPGTEISGLAICYQLVDMQVERAFGFGALRHRSATGLITGIQSLLGADDNLIAEQLQRGVMPFSMAESCQIEVGIEENCIE